MDSDDSNEGDLKKQRVRLKTLSQSLIGIMQSFDDIKKEKVCIGKQ